MSMPSIPGHTDQSLKLSGVLHTSDNILHLILKHKALTIIDSGIINKNPLWLYLSQPLQDSLATHVTAIAREQSPQHRSTEEHAKNIDAIACDHGNSITLFDAMCSERISEQSCSISKLAPRERPAGQLALSHLDQCYFIVFLVASAAGGAGSWRAGVENVFGVVQSNALEPFRETVDSSRGINDLKYLLRIRSGEVLVILQSCSYLH